MATIKPFRALRPETGLTSKIASLPYDVVSREEALTYSRGNPFSFYHVVKAEIDLPPETDEHSKAVYKKAKENFDRLVKNRILIQDAKECFYIYRQKMKEHTQTGIVACIAVDEYISNTIKKHELTREEKEKDRTNHIATLKANTGPVFLIYRQKNEIDALIEKVTAGKPEVSFCCDFEVTHEYWILDDAELIGKIAGCFKDVPSLYVADGHHRLAAAANTANMYREKNKDFTGHEEFNFAMGIVFPHNQIKILPYNRVLRDVDITDREQYLSTLKKDFRVGHPDNGVPGKKGVLCMYMGGKWFSLELKDPDAVSGTADRLDVSVLQDKILSKIFGIEDPRKDKRLDFIGGNKSPDELKKLVDSGAYKIAFSLFPTSVNDLFEISDEGGIMPPKSTWFEPKLRSGIFVHLLE
ncbi:MAG: DUF1015 domain-containing protein [Candidatus Aureabacteria bacterium]|nr:DUF1015 domain-containing protein [Candidatus Auribacterota bacterium]